MNPVRGLRCTGELVIESPDNKRLTLSAEGESLVLFSAGQARDFLPLLRILRSRRPLLAPSLAVLEHAGLITRVVAAGRVIAVLGQRGNWLGRLVGLPGARIHLLSALRAF